MKPMVWMAVAGCLLIAGCAAHDYRREGRAVTLILRKPDAHEVVLLTSLDRFSPRPAKNISGAWEVTLPATQPFRYFYRIDGVPFVPDCPLKEKDDFGSENCVFDPQL
ncbi:hypothetical protein [Desulfosarcina ovata]|uniref:Glycoside hydrolase family 13 N-terminal domain-containing protein n=2 Tax=Desulfosarcina ovata TaxID=83564 RepID=A0A5K8AHQ2_9BACT|nr:hypothetical protein [Desulfosarcina ovata]BBO85300.1 hypothetical protein DSCO28_58660 [Desulfosarcina ovata subsp. sediminis]BBO92197.1 hypothetical protein DSCOOX_53770 [Desulfosarcina ovata subsp. ovata]